MKKISLFVGTGLRCMTRKPMFQEDGANNRRRMGAKSD